MSNILISVEHGIEVAATDVLKWLGAAGKVVTKAENAEPQVVAALGVVFGALATAVSDVSQVATNPVNLTLDAQTIQDLKAIWPDIKSFLATFGVKV